MTSVTRRPCAHLESTIEGTTHPMVSLAAQVLLERVAQDEEWGEQNHPDGTGYAYLRELADKARRECDAAARAGTVTWRLILREEYREVLAESDPARLRAELIQLAAVAQAWAESIDRRAAS